MNRLAYRTASMITVVLVLAGHATGARADEPCPLLDPTCLDETVEDVVDDVTDTVDEVTGDVRDTVDEVTDPDGGGGGPAPEPGDGDGEGEPNGEGDRSGGEAGRDHRPALTANAPDLTARPAVHVAGNVADPRGHVGIHGRATAPSWIPSGSLLTRTATGVGVMLTLLGLAFAFAAFQHALDRRDPKLAADALGYHEVPFE
jgi:hypothetical protein